MVINTKMRDILYELSGDKMEYRISVMISEFKNPNYLFQLIQFRNLMITLGKILNSANNDFYEIKKSIIDDKNWHNLNYYYVDDEIYIEDIEKWIIFIADNLEKIRGKPLNL